MSFLYDIEDMPRLVALMVEAVRAGASEALRCRAIGLRAQAKSQADGDFVTQGDKASQAAIFALLPTSAEIDGQTQDIGFYGEEAMHESYVFPEKAQWRWCVDPIDGTKPYFNGDYYWCVSIALQKKSEDGERWYTALAALYRATDKDAPEHLQGRVYWALIGGGAYVLDLTTGEQRKLGVPAHIAPVVEFEIEPEVATDHARAYAGQAKKLIEAKGLTHVFRRTICHATCEMLEGEKAGVIQGVAGPFDWDIAAISLIAAEAGAHISFEPRVRFGEHWRYPAVIVWDSELFKQLVPQQI